MVFMKYNDKDYSKVKNKIEGNVGEIKAVNFLKKKKYKIITTNYKNKIGEIDIIAEKDDLIVFVEVKNRSTFAFGRPIEAVTLQKQNKIKKVAEIFLMMNHIQYHNVRFDVIEVFDNFINHTENAFM